MLQYARYEILNAAERCWIRTVQQRFYSIHTSCNLFNERELHNQMLTELALGYLI